jgi:hypothetical protein
MGANGAPGQELQIAPKNRFRANFLRKLWTYHFLLSPYFHRRFAWNVLDLLLVHTILKIWL